MSNMWSIEYEKNGLKYSMTLIADYFEALCHASRIDGFVDLSEIHDIIDAENINADAFVYKHANKENIK